MSKKLETAKIAGIDYGSRFAGTTCIAFIDKSNILQVFQSEKKKCADSFLLAEIKKNAFERVFIDAPLSLPIIYSEREVDTPDFHFRSCDREVGGMSPMFLGGLTARAMQLKYQLSSHSIYLHEVYPAYIANNLYERYGGYKDKNYEIRRYWNHIKASFPIKKIQNLPDNWHQIDAILALLSGIRFLGGTHLSFGTKEEGKIIV